MKIVISIADTDTYNKCMESLKLFKGEKLNQKFINAMSAAKQTVEYYKNNQKLSTDNKKLRKRVATLQQQIAKQNEKNRVVDFDAVEPNNFAAAEDSEEQIPTDSDSDSWIPNGIFTAKIGILSGVIGILLIVLLSFWNPNKQADSTQAQQTQTIKTESENIDSIALHTLQRVQALTIE